MSDQTFLSDVDLAFSDEVSGSVYDELEARRKKKAEEQAFFRATDRATGREIDSPENPDRKRRVSKEDEAHELIAFAADAERSLVERSNQFDRWKQLVGELAGSTISKPVYYRQILGLLLEKVTRKDVTDFAADVLARMVTATYYLRSEAPNASHVNYILDVLRPHAQTGLSVDELSEAQIEKLEAIERRIRGE